MVVHGDIVNPGIKRICVFCGSQTGKHPRYQHAATTLGRLLAQRGLGLVYGGGSVGLMGVIANAVLQAGGDVIGVIPEALVARELAHTAISQLHVEPSMHARKARMAELADAFIAMPGGYGTLEELFEIMTWAQLGIHRKPIGLCNVAGYFDALAALINHAVQEGFISSEHRQFLVITDHPATLLDALVQHRMPLVRPWLNSTRT
jgi:uncharacterized protein (TIGR00730 family)